MNPEQKDKRHLCLPLLICGQADLPNHRLLPPGYWNVISIRNPFGPVPCFEGFGHVHSLLFFDVDDPMELPLEDRAFLPCPHQLMHVFRVVDQLHGKPFIIHCWSGIRRSTAVGLLLMLRESLKDTDLEDACRLACDWLMQLRPQAVPNPLVLSRGLRCFLSQSESDRILARIWDHPALAYNRSLRDRMR